MKKSLILLLLLVTLQNSFAGEYLENAGPAKDTKSDWMELKSGEWVRGEFKGVYSGKVEFDSDEFNLVKFDVDDVKQIITVGNSTVNLNREMPSLKKFTTLPSSSSSDTTSLTVITGNLNFKNGEFSIKAEDGTSKIIHSSDIASVAAGELRESNYWSASIYLGLDILRGNSEQVTITGKASAERRTYLTRFRADYLSTYTKVDANNTTADNNRLTSSLDLYQTSHFYWRLASLEYLRDPFKNIAARYTLGAGVGYDILYSGDYDWSVTAGPGYQSTSYSEIVVTGDNKATTGLIFLDTRFKAELMSDVDFLINYHMYYVNKKSGRYTHHMEVSLETEIINDFTLNFSVFWDRVDEPSPFADGSLPKKNDYKSMLAIGYSY